MGYLLLPLTVIADLLGGYGSYYYGASVLPYAWTLLGRFLAPGLLYIITWPLSPWVHRVPPPWPLPALIPYFHHPAWPMSGQIWVGLFLAAHLYYAIKHLTWRYNPTHRGIPQAGRPGEARWELVQRRWHDFAEALDRISQKAILRRPIWRYTTEPYAPVAELRGRLLLIREGVLQASAVRILAPELARQLGVFNSHDWFFNDVLDYYPRRFLWRHLLLGIGIWIPTALKETVWPLLHWRRRVVAYDTLIWMCGQAQQLYDSLAAQGTYDRSFFAPWPLLQQRLGHLEALIRSEYQWMQEHHLIDADSEPPILHGPAVHIPLRIDRGPDLKE